MSSLNAASEGRVHERSHSSHSRSQRHRSSGRRGSTRRYFGRYSKRQVQKALFLAVVISISLAVGYLIVY